MCYKKAKWIDAQLHRAFSMAKIRTVVFAKEFLPGFPGISW